MLFHHGLHVEQAEAVALHVVQVARGHAVELVEHVALPFPGNADAFVADGEDEGVALPAARYRYLRPAGRVLYGVVQQVAHDVGKVRAVGLYLQRGRVDVQTDVHGLVGLQLVLLYEGAYHVACGEGGEVQCKGLAPLHRHAEYLLHQSAQAVKLFLADGEVASAFGLVGVLAEVQQGVVGGVGYGDGGLQLVGDVVGEVVLHLLQRALAQQGADKVPEGEAQDEHDAGRRGQYARHLPQHQSAHGLRGEPVEPLAVQVVAVLIGLGPGGGGVACRAPHAQCVDVGVGRIYRIAAVQVRQSVGHVEPAAPQLVVQQAVVGGEVRVVYDVQPRMQSPLEVARQLLHGVLAAEEEAHVVRVQRGVDGGGVFHLPLLQVDDGGVPALLGGDGAALHVGRVVVVSGGDRHLTVLDGILL